MEKLTPYLIKLASVGSDFGAETKKLLFNLNIIISAV